MCDFLSFIYVKTPGEEPVYIADEKLSSHSEAYFMYAKITGQKLDYRRQSIHEIEWTRDDACDLEVRCSSAYEADLVKEHLLKKHRTRNRWIARLMLDLLKNGHLPKPPIGVFALKTKANASITTAFQAATRYALLTTTKQFCDKYNLPAKDRRAMMRLMLLALKNTVECDKNAIKQMKDIIKEYPILGMKWSDVLSHYSGVRYELNEDWRIDILMGLIFNHIREWTFFDSHWVLNMGDALNKHGIAIGRKYEAEQKKLFPMPEDGNIENWYDLHGQRIAIDINLVILDAEVTISKFIYEKATGCKP